MPDGLTPHRQPEVTKLPRAAVEGDQPAELERNPTPGVAGDLFSQEPVRPYLLQQPYRLSYVAGDYVPPAGERVDPALLQAMAARGGGGETYGFVMFAGRITSDKRARIEATGVVLRDHHTFNAMTATIPFARSRRAVPSADRVPRHPRHRRHDPRDALGRPERAADGRKHALRADLPDRPAGHEPAARVDHERGRRDVPVRGADH